MQMFLYQSMVINNNSNINKVVAPNATKTNEEFKKSLDSIVRYNQYNSTSVSKWFMLEFKDDPRDI